MRAPWKAVVAAAGVLVGVNVALGVVDELSGGTPGGPTSSSFATGRDGAAAYADLLRRDGRDVERIRETPSQTRLDPGGTVVLLDPFFVLREDARALREFVRAGGRLVAGGSDVGGWLDTVVGGELEWVDETVAQPLPLVPAPEVAGVDDVAGTAGGAWSETAGALPVLGGDEGELVAVARVGAGRVVAVADTGPLQNGALAAGDNAQLALSLAGPAGRDIAFLESYHGYGAATGFAAVPDRWIAALALALAAAAALVLARGRRLGPAEAEARELPPPRRLYVDSLAAVLARSRRPAEAVLPVRERAQRLLGETAGGDAHAARGLGLSEEELVAVRSEPRNAEAVVAAGRALARLERRTRGRRT